MKKILLSSAILLVLAGCQNKSEDVDTALKQMELSSSGKGRTVYADKNISGDKVVLKDLKIDTTGLARRIEGELEGASDYNVVIDLTDANLKVDKLTFDDLGLDENEQAVFKTILFEGLSFEPLDDELSSRMSVKTMALENPSPELSAWLASLFNKAEKSSVPAPETLSFDRLSLSGLSWVDPDLTEDNASGLKTLVLENVKDDKIGSMAFEDLKVKFYDAFSPEPGVFSIADLKVKGGRAAFMSATQDRNPFNSASEISTSILQMPMDDGLDSVSLSDLNFSLDGLTAILPKLAYDVKRDDKGMPLSSTLEPVTLTVTADPEAGLLGAQMSPYLSAYGVDELKVTTSYTSKYDPKTDILETKGNYVEVSQAFRLNYDFRGSGVKKLQDKLGGVDTGKIVTGETGAGDVARDIYSELDLHSLTVSIEDNGAISKLVALSSIMQGETPENIRDKFSGMVAFASLGALMMGVDEAILKDFNAATRTFINEGGTLTLTLTPEEPVSLAKLMDTPSLAKKDTLGLTFTHTKPEPEE